MTKSMHYLADVLYKQYNILLLGCFSCLAVSFSPHLGCVRVLKCCCAYLCSSPEQHLFPDW